MASMLPLLLVSQGAAQAQLLGTGDVLAVRSRDVVRDVLAGVDEVEAGHLPDHQEHAIDRLTGDLAAQLGQPARQAALLVVASASPDVALDDRHGHCPLSSSPSSGRSHLPACASVASASGDRPAM